MTYLDSSYLARLYLEDPGWQSVRELAARDAVCCCVHGRAEVVAVFHRKLREGAFGRIQYRQVLEQFDLDCREDAYRWLPLSPAVVTRLGRVFQSLPRTVFIRASDALHLACAAENHLAEVYSNDRRLIAASPHFGLKGVDAI